MRCRQSMFLGRASLCRAPCTKLPGVFVHRLARRLLGGLTTLLAGAILMAGLTGCSNSKNAKGTAFLAPFNPKAAEAKAEREALRKAVENDPFPAAKSKRVDAEP